MVIYNSFIFMPYNCKVLAMCAKTSKSINKKHLQPVLILKYSVCNIQCFLSSKSAYNQHIHNITVFTAFLNQIYCMPP